MIYRFKTYEEKKIPLLPLGKHKMRVMKLTPKIINSGDFRGTEGVMVVLKKYENGIEYLQTDFFMPSVEDWAWKWRHFLRSAGKEELYELGEFDLQDVVGDEVELENKHEEYNGEIRSKVKDYFGIKKEKNNTSVVDDAFSFSE